MKIKWYAHPIAFFLFLFTDDYVKNWMIIIDEEVKL